MAISIHVQSISFLDPLPVLVHASQSVQLVDSQCADVITAYDTIHHAFFCFVIHHVKSTSPPRTALYTKSYIIQHDVYQLHIGIALQIFLK